MRYSVFLKNRGIIHDTIIGWGFCLFDRTSDYVKVKIGLSFPIIKQEDKDETADGSRQGGLL